MRTGRRAVIAIYVSLALLLGGCGGQEDEALADYRGEMEHFYASLARFDSRIEAIDAEAQDAPEQLLTILREMKGSYAQMAALSVPEAFSAIGDLPREAAENMSLALEKYEEAYADGYDAGAADVADQYYERADKRARLILTILHGEIPEGEGVTVDTEEALHLDVITED